MGILLLTIGLIFIAALISKFHHEKVERKAKDYHELKQSKKNKIIPKDGDLAIIKNKNYIKVGIYKSHENNLKSDSSQKVLSTIINSKQILNSREFSNYKREIFWVDDKHRTHPWSLKPGGSTVVVEYLDGNIFGYDKVKRPDKYLPKIFKEDKRNIYVNWDDNAIYKYLNDYIKKIYASKQGSHILDSIWATGEEELPFEKLEKYRTI